MSSPNPDSGRLISRPDDVYPELAPGDYLKCTRCATRYATVEEVDYDGTVLYCEVCEEFAAFVVSRASKARMTERLPTPLASDFMPVPRALLTYAGDLGLDRIDMLIVLALWWHNYSARSRIYPGEERIAELAHSHKRTVIDRLGKLEKAGLLKRTPAMTGKRRDGTEYDLRPLWARLASIASGAVDVHGRASVVTPCQSVVTPSPIRGDSQSPKREVVNEMSEAEASYGRGVAPDGAGPPPCISADLHDLLARRHRGDFLDDRELDDLFNAFPDAE